MILTGAFFLSAYTTILTPGPNMLYTSTQAAQRGARVGIIAGLACFLGGVIYTVTTTLGLSAALVARPTLFNAVRIAGIAYIIYLGLRHIVRAIKGGPAPVPPNPSANAFREGLLISLTNPQLALFFLSFLPQFVDPKQGRVDLQFLELGLMFNLCALSMLVTVATIAGGAGQAMVVGERFRRTMHALTGSVFLLLAGRSIRALLKA